MSKYLDEIHALCGMEDFKALAERLSLSGQNARSSGIAYPPLPNLILLSASGSGITTAIRLLTGLLREEKLLRFVGEEEYFEILWQEGGDAFDALLARIRAAGGFYGQFRGVIGINVDEPAKLLENQAVLHRLMEYVDLQQGRILFAFVLPLETPADQVTALQRQFMSRTPLETVRIPFPETEAITAFIQKKLSLRGMSLSEAGLDAMNAAINTFRKDKHFEGFQSLNNLIDELVWLKLSQKDGGNGVIDSGLLDKLFAENGLLSIIKEKHAAQRPIGFTR